MRQAKKFYTCLMSGDLSTLKTMSPEKQRRVMQSLSALAKFTGIYEQYKQMIKNYGLKWAVNNDDVIIARLIKYSGGQRNADKLFNWVKNVKEEIPDFKPFMNFIIATGLRLSEVIASYRLIIDLSKQGRLDEYYNFERCVLEHFRFKEHFIRRTKKAFMSFLPKELIDSVRYSNFYPTNDVIVRRIRRRNLGQRFSDIRECWATRMTRYLSQPEIDFLQGRVSANVFMTNYFNPGLINDLKQRTLDGIQSLMENNKVRNMQSHTKMVSMNNNHTSWIDYNGFSYSLSW